jgi:hypothetical protein
MRPDLFKVAPIHYMARDNGPGYTGFNMMTTALHNCRGVPLWCRHCSTCMNHVLWRVSLQAAVLGVPFVDALTTERDPTLPLTVGEWEEWGAVPLTHLL